MKATTLTFFFIFLAKFLLFSQQAIQWQKSLGGSVDEIGTSVQATNDGGCIIVGSTASYDGDATGNHGGYTDGWIVKLDLNGDIEWERSVGGSSQENLNAVALTTDGGYIAVGNTTSDDGDVTGSSGVLFGNQIWVVKFDSLGNIEWNNCYGGSRDDYSGGISLTTDGGYIITGSSNSTDGDVTGYHPPANPFDSANDIWCFKIDNTGVLQWQKCLGGSKSENSRVILQTPDSGYIVFGMTFGSFDGDVIGNTDTSTSGGSSLAVWIVKLDPGQNIVWQRTYGGSGIEFANGLVHGPDNTYTFCSATSSRNGDVTSYIGDTSNTYNQYWLVNIDSSGLIQWQKCFGGDSCWMSGGSLTRTATGGYAIGGGAFLTDSDLPGYHVNPLNELSTDYAVIVCDSVGTLDYQRCYGGFKEDQGNDISISANNEIFVVGSSGSNDGDVSGHHGPLNFPDIWVIKFSPLTINVPERERTLHAFKVYPNPVSASANVAFYLPVANRVTVKIYDISGKEIKTLLNKDLNAGFQEMNWDCTTDEQQAVANGIYMVRITAGEYVSFTKITVIR